MKYILPADQLAAAREVHPSQRQHHIQPVNAPLYVVTSYSNIFRFYSRQKLYQRFEKMCEDAGAILYTVELALRDRHFEITSPFNPRHIQLRSPAELWHKENLINVGVSRLPADWEYVAWIDADVEFARPDWAVETIHQLQHYKLIQMFSHAMDLIPDPQSPGHAYAPASYQFRSFMYSYLTNGTHAWFPSLNTPAKAFQGASGAGAYWHPGFAWAARRSALSDLGGLGDRAVLGAADYYMAAALVGAVDRVMLRSYTADYRAYWENWQRRAQRSLTVSDIGYMPGFLMHHYHGPKAKRRYETREQILADEKYEPSRDLKYDPQGVLDFEGNKPRLEVKIREYFRARDEDAVS
jgi:hypothetical protein